MATPNEPTRPVRDAVEADLLAVPGGVRPVVWRAASPRGVLSQPLARLLFDDQTRRGDVVIDVDDDVLFAAASAETGRRHHALGGDTRLAALGDAAGYADLVLLRWPRPQANPRWLLVACRTLLRAGTGVLVVAVTIAAAQRTSHLSALTGAAHAAGLRHVRHIAIVAPDTPDASAGPTDADDATPPVPDTGAAGGGGGGGGGHTTAGVGRLTPHTDLLVFVAQAGHDD
jgi:hypothetical protein